MRKDKKSYQIGQQKLKRRSRRRGESLKRVKKRKYMGKETKKLTR